MTPVASRRLRPETKRGLPDEALAMFDKHGELLHVAPPEVVSSLRHLLGRFRMGTGVAVPERLGITSTITGEGVTFISRSLAVVMAHDTGRRVCLVELNWSNPTLGPDGRPLPGMADVLRGSLTLDEALVGTLEPSLALLPAGAATPAERSMLANSEVLDKKLTELGSTYSHLVIDLPALRAASEALTLAVQNQALIMVIAAGVTHQPQIRSALDDLGHTEVLGAVVNRSSSMMPSFVQRWFTY